MYVNYKCKLRGAHEMKKKRNESTKISSKYKQKKLEYG